jgi:hypothetical protein
MKKLKAGSSAKGFMAERNRRSSRCSSIRKRIQNVLEPHKKAASAKEDVLKRFSGV